MRFATKEPALPEVNMTPMIDIVFQLIAFFMVISNFEQTQADERVKLPRDALARPPEVAREQELVLNVGFVRDKEGNKVNPNAVVFFAGELVPVLDMGPKLERESYLTSELGTDLKELTVVIRADAEVPTGLVQELMRLAQDADFEKFSLKATQKIGE
jgi:biopolymer transport protein ExbD